MVFNLEVLRATVARGGAGSPAAETKLLRYAEILNEELNRLHERLETLFVFLRPPRKPGESQTAAQILQQVAAMLVPTASKRRIAVRVDEPDEDAAMPGGTGVRDALLQLGLAALDGLETGGDLVLEAEAEAETETTGGLLLVRIAGGPTQGAEGAGEPDVAIARMLVEAAGGRLRRIDDSLSTEPAVGYEIEFPESRNLETVNPPPRT
jgi:hypothetical protein